MTRRIVKAVNVALRVGKGDDARTVDLFAGDELPDSLSAEQVKALDEQGALVPVGGEQPESQPDPEGKSLEDLKRPELDELAASLGIENPGDLPNKGAVIEAIEAKRAEGGDTPPEPETPPAS